MKLTVTVELTPEIAARENITFEGLKAFAEELKTDALNTIPDVTVTIETEP